MFVFVHINNILRKNTAQEMNFVVSLKGSKPVATLLHWCREIHSLWLDFLISLSLHNHSRGSNCHPHPTVHFNVCFSFSYSVPQRQLNRVRN